MFRILYILGVCVLQAQCNEIILNQQINPNEIVQNNFLLLLEYVKLELNYKHIIFWKFTKDHPCLIEDTIKNFNAPLMILYEKPSDNLLQMHSNECLIIRCEYDEETDPDSEHIWGYRLQHYSYILFLKDEDEMWELEMWGNWYGMPGLIMVTNESLHKPEFHMYATILYDVIDLKYSDIKRVIKNRYTNYIYWVKTEVTTVPPYAILYYEIPKGETEPQPKITGYVANCISTFAERYQTILKITLLEVEHYKDLVKQFDILTHDNIPSLPLPLKHEGLTNYTYPIEFIEECFMIPMPNIIPPNQVFFIITDPVVLLIIMLLSMIFTIFLTIGQYSWKFMSHLSFVNIVLNDKSIRTLLGQSFVMPVKPSLFMKYIYFLLFYSNIMIMTSYLAFLGSNLISPSYEDRIKSLADIKKAGLKIAVHHRDFEDWDPNFYENYEDILYIIQGGYENFTKLRDSLDLRYVYPVTDTAWTIYHEQQKLFQRKLFFYSSELCLSKLTMVSLATPTSTAYRPLINQHLMEMRESGLFQKWKTDVFFTLVRFDLLSFKDLSTPNEYDGIIDMNDLLWIWILYIMCMLISLIAFVGELIVYKVVKSEI